MKKLLAKLNDKTFLQKLILELVGDAFMLVLGLLVAYYIKVYLIGF